MVIYGDVTSCTPVTVLHLKIAKSSYFTMCNMVHWALQKTKTVTPPEEEPGDVPEDIPEEEIPEDPRITRLKEAYDSGKISKEIYEKNLARFSELKR